MDTPAARAGYSAVADPPAGHGLRVLVAVPGTVTRLGLESMLRMLSIVRHVTAVGDLAEAQAELSAGRFDLFIASADVTAAEDAALHEMAQRRQAKFLLMLRDDADVDRMARFTADGYLLETRLTPRSLEEAMDQLTRGESLLPFTFAQNLLTHIRHPVRRPLPRALLTSRQCQVLGLLVDGLSNKEIASRLGVSEHGAKRHVANLLGRLNCPNRTLAVALALREGLLDATPE